MVNAARCASTTCTTAAAFAHWQGIFLFHGGRNPRTKALSYHTHPSSSSQLPIVCPTTNIRPSRSCRLASKWDEEEEEDQRTKSSNIFPEDDYEDEELFLRKELAHVESLEKILQEFEEFDVHMEDEDEDEDEDDEEEEAMQDLLFWDSDSLTELLGSIEEEEEEDIDDDDELLEDASIRNKQNQNQQRQRQQLGDPFARLERALMEDVVPVSAGVGTDCLPGDFGFDPLNLATKDYFRQVQGFILGLLPDNRSSNDNDDQRQAPASAKQQPRPRALILRDYREAEIRHSRLAMLAALFWPLQEMLDRLLLPPELFGPLIYGPVTLPYFPLLMTAIMLLLGYLDIYSQSIKDMDKIGEAFLPGDCFWDPLKILQGAPDSMKRRMQERELFNGRAAMLAVLAYTWEEAMSHRAVIDVEGNALLFQPFFQLPFFQKWLDEQFTVFPPADIVVTAVDGSLIS